MMNKIFKRLGSWWDDFTFWWEWEYLWCVFVVAIIVGFVLLILYASGVFFDEVESYDFTAVVTEKEHYTTQTISYIKSGNSSIPVYHTHHHYKIYWVDGEEADAIEIGVEQYNRTNVGDYVNIHCSVREDKQGELHYYYYNGQGN